MAGTAHLRGHVRWPGKPTSGRYVYAPRRDFDFEPAGIWYWQCDLHDDYDIGDFGAAPTMQEAFAKALDHARNHCSERWREEHTHVSRFKRDECASGHCDHDTIVFAGFPKSDD